MFQQSRGGGEKRDANCIDPNDVELFKRICLMIAHIFFSMTYVFDRLHPPYSRLGMQVGYFEILAAAVISVMVYYMRLYFNHTYTDTAYIHCGCSVLACMTPCNILIKPIV